MYVASGFDAAAREPAEYRLRIGGRWRLAGVEGAKHQPPGGAGASVRVGAGAHVAFFRPVLDVVAFFRPVLDVVAAHGDGAGWRNRGGGRNGLGWSVHMRVYRCPTSTPVTQTCTLTHPHTHTLTHSHTCTHPFPSPCPCPTHTNPTAPTTLHSPLVHALSLMLSPSWTNPSPHRGLGSCCQ